MIVAERKPIETIQQMLEPYENVLMVGCGMCVAVCGPRAIEVAGWRLDQFEAMVDAIAADY